MTRERIEDMREVVLPFVKKRLLETNYEGLGEADAKEFEREFNEVLNLAIKALEQEPRWIPVSERLPEVGSKVLVCFDFKGNRSVYISEFYGDGKFHGFDDEYLTSEGRKYRKAVAWMPLPKAYREVEE